jgi:hypothetical protein
MGLRTYVWDGVSSWVETTSGGSATVIGTSPISVTTSGSTATVSLTASYATSTHLHDSDYVNVGGDTMSGQLYVSSTTTTTTVGFGDIIFAKNTSYGSIAVNSAGDNLHIRSKNAVEVIGQTGATPVSLRAKSIGVNSNTTSPTLVDDGITFGDDANLYRVSVNALKTDDALEVAGLLTNGGTSVSLSTHTHAYQPVGTYVTSVSGTAPITASTTTAGAATVGVSTGTTSATVALGDHLHTGTYDLAGTAASAVSTHTAVTTSVHGITNTANLLTTTSNLATISNASGTATTITSTTSTAPTDISGLQFVFTPTYDEDVLLEYNLVITQSATPTAGVNLVGKITVNGTQAAPFSYTGLTASHGSPSGWTQGQSHTFAAISGNAYTVKVSAYKSSANGTYTASNGSTFSMIRMRS